ncbi:MAG: hypothetical protein Q8L07_09495 [Sediminibacterium sp.]|nr:hypothetical protein [Sediminibacterium sp.]
MKKFLRNPNLIFVLGFLVLPAFLIFLCIVVNLFAPVSLNFPKPQLIFSDLAKSLTEQKVLLALTNTFKNVFTALILSFLSGIFAGILLGHSRKVWNLSQPTIDFFRSIPVTFLIPVTALLIGVTSSNIVWILAAYPCMLIMILNVRAGLSKQETERVLAYSIISGSTNPVKKFFRVTLFEILPDVSTGFRIALSYCIVIVTVLEYMNIGNNGSNPGIGKLISEEAELLHYPRVYALIFLIGFIGFLLNKAVELFDYFFLHWAKNTTDDNK